jgi:hypothetical protein
MDANRRGPSGYQEPTRPVALTVAEAWLLHDCLQQHLMGFAGRDPSTRPWHAESALRRLATALLAAADGGLTAEAAVAVAFTAEELTILTYHLPRTAGRTAQDVLVRLWRAREELELGIPLLAADPTPTTARQRLEAWRRQAAEIGKGGEGDGDDGDHDGAGGADGRDG